MTIPAAPPPTHPGLLDVQRAGGKGEYLSSLRVLKPFAAGEVLCAIEGTSEAGKAYSSVQVGPGNQHIELNSDLVYCNHSCDPNVAFEVPADRAAWRVRALKDLKAGETICFCYLSTEWEMGQPFDCFCGSSKCLGRISGAKDTPLSVLNGYWLNDHIRLLKKQQVAHQK